MTRTDERSSLFAELFGMRKNPILGGLELLGGEKMAKRKVKRGRVKRSKRKVRRKGRRKR